MNPASHSASAIPHDYNFAADILKRNLDAGRRDKIAFIDQRGQYSYGDLAGSPGTSALYWPGHLCMTVLSAPQKRPVLVPGVSGCLASALLRDPVPGRLPERPSISVQAAH